MSQNSRGNEVPCILPTFEVCHAARLWLNAAAPLKMNAIVLAAEVFHADTFSLIKGFGAADSFPVLCREHALKVPRPVSCTCLG